jgi:hypothetical protein
MALFDVQNTVFDEPARLSGYHLSNLARILTYAMNFPGDPGFARGQVDELARSLYEDRMELRDSASPIAAWCNLASLIDSPATASTRERFAAVVDEAVKLLKSSVGKKQRKGNIDRWIYQIQQVHLRTLSNSDLNEHAARCIVEMTTCCAWIRANELGAEQGWNWLLATPSPAPDSTILPEIYAVISELWPGASAKDKSFAAAAGRRWDVKFYALPKVPYQELLGFFDKSSLMQTLAERIVRGYSEWRGARYQVNITPRETARPSNITKLRNSIPAAGPSMRLPTWQRPYEPPTPVGVPTNTELSNRYGPPPQPTYQPPPPIPTPPPPPPQYPR